VYIAQLYSGACPVALCFNSGEYLHGWKYLVLLWAERQGKFAKFRGKFDTKQRLIATISSTLIVKVYPEQHEAGRGIEDFPAFI
jgi:hypothetical protein